MRSSVPWSSVITAVGLAAIAGAAALANVPNRCSACPVRPPPAIALSANPNTLCPGHVTITARLNVAPNTKLGYRFTRYYLSQGLENLNPPLLTTDASGQASVSAQFPVNNSQEVVWVYFALYAPPFSLYEPAWLEAPNPIWVQPRCVTPALQPLQVPKPTPIMTRPPR